MNISKTRRSNDDIARAFPNGVGAHWHSGALGQPRGENLVRMVGEN